VPSDPCFLHHYVIPFVRLLIVSCVCQTFANDEGDDPSRVGAASDPLMEGIEQLDTMISFRDGGSGISRDLQRAASRSQSGRAERNLLTAFRDISNWCDQFSLPKTISDIAKQLYKRSDEEKLLRGKSLDAVIAACIFIACRQAHVPRTFREICQLTHVSKKTLGQCYKALEQAFNLTPGASGDPNMAPSKGPEDLLSRYCNYLDLTPDVQSYARDIIVAAREHGIADGRSPVSIAGGAIFFTTWLMGQEQTAKEISAVAGVSEGTIRIVFKLYWGKKEKLVKEEWIAKGKFNPQRLVTPPSGFSFEAETTTVTPAARTEEDYDEKPLVVTMKKSKVVKKENVLPSASVAASPPMTTVGGSD